MRAAGRCTGNHAPARIRRDAASKHHRRRALDFSHRAFGTPRAFQSIRRCLTMIPTTLVLPAAVPPGILGALIDPSTAMGLLAGIAVAGLVGLCVALARESFTRTSKPAIMVVRRERLAA